MHLGWLLLVVLAGPSADPCQPCDSVDSCLPKLATPEISDCSDAKLTLNNLRTVTWEDAPALIAAHQRVGGLEFALARTGAPEALDVLAGQLKRSDRGRQRTRIALSTIGDAGLPHVLRLYDCEDCSDLEPRTLHRVLAEMPGGAEKAPPRLEAIVQDPQRPTAARRAALRALIALEARGALQRLQGLRSEPELRTELDRAAHYLALPHAVALRLREVDASPYENRFRALAEMGEAARAAGPLLEPYLRPEAGAHARYAAIRTLGHIDYHGFNAQLIEMLDHPDWPQVEAAVQTLGRLRVHEAHAALEQVHASYWYPPVRDEAGHALAALAGRESYATELGNWDVAGADYGPPPRPYHLSPELCRAGCDRPDTPAVRRTYVVHRYGTPSELTQPARVALQVEDGWLLGASRGEWGGELVHVDREGNQTPVDHGQLQGLMRVGDKIVAVYGLAHMGSNWGSLWWVHQRDGRWTTEFWMSLPSATRRPYRLADGRHLILTSRAPVVIGTDGSVSLAPTVSPPGKPITPGL